MRLILHYLKRYKKLFIINVISVFGFALVELGIPIIIADMIDVGVMNVDMDYIICMGFVVLLISLIGASMTILPGYYYAKISTAITRDIRNDILDHTRRFTTYEFNKFGISSMITRTNNDTFQIQMFVNVLFHTALVASIMFVASIITTAGTSLSLSGIIVATVPLIIIEVFAVARISKPIFESQQTSLDSLNRVSRENLGGIYVIRAFDNDAYEQQRFDDTNEEFTDYSKKLLRLMMMTSPIFFLLMDVAGLCIYQVAVLLTQGGDLPLSQLVIFIGYLFRAVFSIMLFCTVFMMYPRAEVSTKRIEAVFDTVPLVHNNGRRMDGNQQGMISFEHVVSVYPDGGESVLKDISFSAKKGEAIALIGSTGLGKSILVNLIPRLYDVDKGSIRIDSVDICDYDLFELRSRLGVILQKVFLFSGMITDNIRFGKSDTTTEEAMQVAKTAQTCNLIIEKEHGFEEEITEGMTNVFSGQKRRSSITRALVRKPDIYVFDDPLPTLGFRADAALHKELRKEAGDIVIMVAAQRISNIMEVDCIIVLNGGNTIGTGIHRELLKNYEIYRGITLSQFNEEGLAHE